MNERMIEEHYAALGYTEGEIEQIKRIGGVIEDDDDYDSCPNCSGTGEGKCEGENCWICGGSGRSSK